MTKAELEKEAEKFLGGWLIDPEIVKLFVDFAKPREKQIQALGERCLQLQKDKGELIDKVRELEKENAELKHIIATLRQEKDNVSMHAKAMEVVAKTRSDQLIKAKELLKKFMKFYERTARECYSKDFQKTLADTEQFISEVE